MSCHVVLFRICWVTTDIFEEKYLIPRKFHRKPILLPKQIFDKNLKKA